MRFPDDQFVVTAVNKNVEIVYSDFTPLLFLVRPSTILDSFESNNKKPLKNQACLILKGFYVKIPKRFNRFRKPLLCPTELRGLSLG